MKVDTIQTSFVGGEFGPPLMGRVDIVQYANACQIVQNWLIRPFGSIISTPGTQFIAAAKTGGVTSIVRLLPFVFSQTDAYVIEMGVGYFRFYTNGAVVVSTGTTPYEISHPYVAADISTVQFTQNHDVIYLTHANYAPQQLIRSAAASWQLTPLPFTGGPFMPANNTAVTLLASSITSGSTASITVSVPTWATNTSYAVGQYILSGSTLYQCIVANTAGGALTVTGAATTFANSASIGTIAWTTSTQKVTNGGVTNAVSEYLVCTGFGFSIPTNATINGIVANINRNSLSATVTDSSIKIVSSSTILGTEHSAVATWSTLGSVAVYGTSTDLWGVTLSAVSINDSGFGIAIAAGFHNQKGEVANVSYTQFTIYYTVGGFSSDLAAGYWKSVSGIFQAAHVNSFWSLGSTTTNATTGLAVQGYFQITSFGSSTAVTATVITLLSTAGATTVWAEGSWSSIRGWPARCAFFQSRLIMARTNSEPNTVWGSINFNFNDFSVNGGSSNDALNLPLSSTQGNDIKWLIAVNDLLAGTYGGMYAISAGIGTGNPITPANAGVTSQDSWGSEAIIPKKIGNFIYYIQRYFQKLREVQYQWTTSNYKAIDRTILSPQMAGGGFIDMAWQQNPDTVLWCICSNGTIATMTREVDQEVQGWSHQVTAGTYSSIAVIPSQSGNYDEVWVIVSRTINGSQVNYIERFSNQVLPVKGDYVTPQNDLLNYVHCGSTYNAFSVVSSSGVTISLSSTSGVITITSSSAYFSAGQVGNRIRVVDAYDNSLGEGKINAFTSSTVINVSVTTTFLSTSSTSWGISVTTISGLSYLQTASVVALGDGLVLAGTFTVTSSSITLPADYFVVNVGIQQTQKLLTLPPEAGAQRGTAQGKVQRIANVGFKLNNSYQGFSISGTTGTLQQVVTSNSTLFSGVKPNISLGSDYARGAQLYIQNSDPLPIEITSIILELDTHER